MGHGTWGGHGLACRCCGRSSHAAGWQRNWRSGATCAFGSCVQSSTATVSMRRHSACLSACPSFSIYFRVRDGEWPYEGHNSLSLVAGLSFRESRVVVSLRGIPRCRTALPLAKSQEERLTITLVAYPQITRRSWVRSTVRGPIPLPLPRSQPSRMPRARCGGVA